MRPKYRIPSPAAVVGVISFNNGVHLKFEAAKKKLPDDYIRALQPLGPELNKVDIDVSNRTVFMPLDVGEPSFASFRLSRMTTGLGIGHGDKKGQDNKIGFELQSGIGEDYMRLFRLLMVAQRYGAHKRDLAYNNLMTAKLENEVMSHMAPESHKPLSALQGIMAPYLKARVQALNPYNGHGRIQRLEIADIATHYIRDGLAKMNIFKLAPPSLLEVMQTPKAGTLVKFTKGENGKDNVWKTEKSTYVWESGFFLTFPRVEFKTQVSARSDIKVGAKGCKEEDKRSIGVSIRELSATEEQILTSTELPEDGDVNGLLVTAKEVRLATAPVYELGEKVSEVSKAEAKMLIDAVLKLNLTL